MKLIKIILSALIISFSSLAAAEVPGWKITEISGDVAISSNKMSRTGRRGDRLKIGEIIVTGGSGRAVMARDGDYVIITSNSRIQISDPKVVGGFTQIIQIFGKAVFNINKQSKPHFAVKTPNLAAVVKGTRFTVTVEPGGCSVTVSEGSVEISTQDGGANFLAHSGDTASVMTSSRQQIDITGNKTGSIISSNPQPMMSKPNIEM